VYSSRFQKQPVSSPSIDVDSLGQDHPEADEVDAHVRLHHEPGGAPGVLGLVVPAAPLEHPVFALRRPGGIQQLRILGMCGEPIHDPFPDIAVYVVEPPGVRLFLGNRVGLVL